MNDVQSRGGGEGRDPLYGKRDRIVPSLRERERKRVTHFQQDKEKKEMNLIY